jgi:glycosyltransferase involved in cell wall biosynthesis
MGHGNAILANDVPEHRETLGDAGRYYNGSGELADRLQALLDDPLLADELRTCAHQRASDRYGWEAITNAYETWLQSLVDG